MPLVPAVYGNVSMEPYDEYPQYQLFGNIEGGFTPFENERYVISLGGPTYLTTRRLEMFK